MIPFQITSDIGNNADLETLVHSPVIQADLLAQNGDKVVLEYSFLQQNGTEMAYYLVILFDTGFFGYAQNLDVAHAKFRIVIMRTGANSARYSCEYVVSSLDGIPDVFVGEKTGLDFTEDISIGGVFVKNVSGDTSDAILCTMAFGDFVSAA